MESMVKIFEVEFEGKKENRYYLEKGTIWIPKRDQDQRYQPLVQKNRVLIEFKEGNKNKQILYMFCGDRIKSVPYGIQYIPTDVILFDPISQQDVWGKTETFSRSENKPDL